jgi:murein DD-endopeptidase MepM/ murein hydrolase activator NlpD
MNDFDPDVRDFADQLSRTDFSRESRIRYSLRQRLLAHRPTRRFSPVIRVATVAAMLMLVIVGAGLILPPTSQVMSATEISLQPTPSQGQKSSQQKFDNIGDLEAVFEGDVYYPQSLPEGYEYYFSWANGETIKSIFYNKRALESALIVQTAYGMELDYLYLVQQPDQVDVGDMPHPFAIGSIYYEWVKSRGEIGISSATIEDGRSALIALWNNGGWDFQMWSYQLSAEELEAVAQSVITLQEMRRSGTCSEYSFGMRPLQEWGKPITSKDYPARLVDSTIHIDTPSGVAVSAVNDGRIVSFGKNPNGDGQMVVIAHDGYYSYYEGLSVTSVNCHMPWIKGHAIGGIGDAGLRLTITNEQGEKINPTTLIDFTIVTPTVETPAPESTGEVAVSGYVCGQEVVGIDIKPQNNPILPVYEKWAMPISNASIVSPYAPGHFGIEYSATLLPSIFAANTGIVVSIEEDANGANITLAHGDYFSRYSRVTNVSVTCGDSVISGRKIAEGGNGSLYFQIFDQAMRPVDPETLLDFNAITMTRREFQSIVFEADTPGSCPSQSIQWDLGGRGQPPIPIGQFTIVREFTKDHSAVLLGAVEGEAVYAAEDGIVVFAGWSNSGTGQTIILAHSDKYTLYGHLSDIAVSCGDRVDGSRNIGKVGATGNTSGAVLRFELMDLDGNRIDPATFIDFTHPR